MTMEESSKEEIEHSAHKPSGWNRTRAEEVETLEKEARVLELRKLDMSYKQIAEQVGYANEGGAQKAAKRALKRLTNEPAEELLKITEEQLKDVYRHTLNILGRKHPLIHNGKPVTVTDENGQTVTLDDDSVKLQAINTLLKIQERKSRMLGLDAPVRQELSGPDGEAIPIEVRAATIAERLRNFKDTNVRELPSATETG